MDRRYILWIVLLFLIVLIFFVLIVREVKAPFRQPVVIKVFFGNNQLDPLIEDCAKVFPVLRQVLSSNKEEGAIEQLLLGPIDREISQGYFSSINQGVVIQNFIINQGVAQIDFNKQLEYQVGGSCRVTRISQQITETLRQFPEIKQVIISIDRRTEDILQP